MLRHAAAVAGPARLLLLRRRRQLPPRATELAQPQPQPAPAAAATDGSAQPDKGVPVLSGFARRVGPGAGERVACAALAALPVSVAEAALDAAGLCVRRKQWLRVCGTALEAARAELGLEAACPMPAGPAAASAPASSAAARSGPLSDAEALAELALFEAELLNRVPGTASAAEARAAPDAGTLCSAGGAVAASEGDASAACPPLRPARGSRPAAGRLVDTALTLVERFGVESGAADPVQLCDAALRTRRATAALRVAERLPALRAPLLDAMCLSQCHSTPAAVVKAARALRVPLLTLRHFPGKVLRHNLVAVAKSDLPDMSAALLEEWLDNAGGVILAGERLVTTDPAFTEAWAGVRAGAEPVCEGAGRALLLAAAVSRERAKPPTDRSPWVSAAEACFGQRRSSLALALLAGAEWRARPALLPCRVPATAAEEPADGGDRRMECTPFVARCVGASLTPHAWIPETLADMQTISSAAELAALASDISSLGEHSLGRGEALVVALDCEWRVDEGAGGSAPALVVSVAAEGLTPTVIDMVSLADHARCGRGARVAASWGALVRALAGRAVVVAGFAVAADVRIISSSFSWTRLSDAVAPRPDAESSGVLAFAPAEADESLVREAVPSSPWRVLDLQPIGACWPTLARQQFARALGLAEPPTSLSKAVLAASGRALPKGWQVCDWRARPLEPSKAAYAAGDAVCVLHIVQHLARRGCSVLLPAE